ncbi:hypothetical protein SAM23877_4454 [Streptomyces ambofaciens ATCC 23877]|uniref:Uncharacterized protein n=1 Tax=Streptomyces ambofaciens (strain ATCC 23877 / 3486 / DSM 40053 / JCM 4204 / NBRC 12836 / NRRL B-2516) TaxID=278992 RepID=A0A0K2AWV3_STRA7|nr:hypothetical protein SAM23877_4454 [Streptomyces ambofaciens ATCC 23877]
MAAHLRLTVRRGPCGAAVRAGSRRGRTEGDGPGHGRRNGFGRTAGDRVMSSSLAPIAQSAERLHGKEKVYGSIPYWGSGVKGSRREAGSDRITAV